MEQTASPIGKSLFNNKTSYEPPCMRVIDVKLTTSILVGSNEQFQIDPEFEM